MLLFLSYTLKESFIEQILFEISLPMVYIHMQILYLLYYNVKQSPHFLTLHVFNLMQIHYD